MTPTLARMVLQKQQSQSGVIQVLCCVAPLFSDFLIISVPPCPAGADASKMVYGGAMLAVRNRFEGVQLISYRSTSIPLNTTWRRFESCQRGRKREHYQWNMDIVGVEGVEAEVRLALLVIAQRAHKYSAQLVFLLSLQLELLASIATFFSSLGIGPEVRYYRPCERNVIFECLDEPVFNLLHPKTQIVGLKVNSRKILQSLINSYGITDQNQFTKVPAHSDCLFCAQTAYHNYRYA